MVLDYYYYFIIIIIIKVKDKGMPGKEAAAKKDKKHNLMREIRIDKLVLNCCVGKALLFIV